MKKILEKKVQELEKRIAALELRVQAQPTIQEIGKTVCNEISQSLKTI